MGNEKAEQFLDKLKDMTEFLIPNYILEGKTSLLFRSAVREENIVP